MGIKKIIKEDLWRYSYSLPFIRKYRNNEQGKADTIRHLLHTYRTIRPVVAKEERSAGADTKELLSRVEIRLNNNSRFVYFLDTSKTIAVPGDVLSNFTLAYDKIIHGSFDELAAGSAGEDAYGKEAVLAADGVRTLVKRIEDALDGSDHPLREQLSACFHHMLSRPAEHFEEALQRILFFNQILWQTRHRLNGLGRLDRILGDFYEKDMETGVISKQDAREMIHDFLWNLNQYSEYKSDALQGDIGQIIILGGLNTKLIYEYNDLTLLFMEVQAELFIPDPKILLRVSKKTPEEIIQTAVNCLTARTGSPLFSNDDVVIPALLDSGIETEDAYDYCVSACWEPLVVGKSIAQNNIASLDFNMALDKILDEGALSFDELFEKYLAENRRVFQERLNALDQMKWAKDPLVSMFMDGSAQNRIDVSEGGCRYPNYGMTTVAISNVIDSLLIIRDLVYDQHQYTLKQLNDARRKDFAGEERIYRQLLNARRYFGHDDEVISLVNRITEDLSKAASEYRNPLGGRVKFGLSSPDYIFSSRGVPGDLSGRKTGMPYNTHISCRDASYTELVGFAGHLDYGGFRYNGNVVDFFVAPHLILDNKEKFTAFMMGAIRTGFFQMQMNILDSETLINAKAHPEEYQGLIVRVWGFSAYFNDLPESYKDLMIERAKAAERIA